MTHHSTVALPGNPDMSQYFMEATHKPLHLEKWSSVQWNIMNVPTSFIWIIILFDKALEYGDYSKLWGCVGKNTW
jgi:hypothetical protein